MSADTVPRYEVPPTTDEEWRHALRFYALDRDKDPASRSISGWLDDAWGSTEAGPSRPTRPLLHITDSDDRLDDGHAFSARAPAGHSPLRPRPAQATQEGTTAATTGAAPHLAAHGMAVQPSTRGSVYSGSTMSNDAPEESYVPTIPSGSIPRPSVPVTEADDCPGTYERRRLRKFWEANGWLPGPLPSKEVRIKRRKALRRLGLTEDENEKRREVMAKYAELAKQMFQTAESYVGILYDDAEFTYTDDPEGAPSEFATGATLCTHSLTLPWEEVTLVADLSKDWRYAKNPTVHQLGSRFYASAPLRYRLHDDYVDIGTICVHDPNARDTFGQRERSMLLNLANMLVFQLTTLQSEMSAKRLSTMYQDAIAFLRRSAVPEQFKGPARKKSRKAREREKKEKEKRPPIDHRDSGFEMPRYPCGEPISHSAIKTGPKETQAAKRLMLQSDRELFNDQAATLRKMLEADDVVILSAADFQLYTRRIGLDPVPKKKLKKEQLVADLLAGRPWPANIEPVITHAPSASESGLVLLGSDGEGQHHVDAPDGPAIVSEFIKDFFVCRRYWYARDDEDDDLSKRVMSLMPAKTHTALALTWMNFNGALRFVTFVAWDRPPSMLGNTAKALPFTWIMNGLTAAALAIRSVRNLEQSQISYSNLQAHELRTPMHQILAITQLLRATMNDLAESPATTGKPVCIQQIRDLLPYLDAIDTSGKTLHGIVDNILSFLDLKGKDHLPSAPSTNLLNSPSGPAQSLEVMMEEVIHEAAEEDKRSRSASGQPASNVETIFEIIPPLLGEEVTEDTGGALRRALSKLLANSYKFIEGAGCVEIYVDYVASSQAPEGCEELSTTKNIGIKIVDTGRGIDEDFVKEKLGEPWAKEDSFATGSGLSVHLAWRIVDLLGGHMEISSSPGKGTMVQIEVPMPKRNLSMPSSPTASPDLDRDDVRRLALPANKMHLGKKVAFVGFDTPGSCPWGLPKVGFSLRRQYQKLGCEVISDVEEADLVIVDGRREEVEDFHQIIDKVKTHDIVVLVSEDHDAHPAAVAKARQARKHIRRFRKPTTPSILRESLFPGQSRLIHSEVPIQDDTELHPINAPERLSANGTPVSTPKHRAHFSPEAPFPPSKRPRAASSSAADNHGLGLGLTWKPKGVSVEDAVANLCLGDYFGSRRRASEHSSMTSASTPSAGSTSEQHESDITAAETHAEDLSSPDTAVDEDQPVKVLVVEDNKINRRILVKILSTKLPIEVCEAEDGVAAVEQFKDFTAPAIVLLDINMPKMDGYQACVEMRLLEKMVEAKGKSKIIAVTALAGEAERKRGLVECGMDLWLTKPCGKATITQVVETARKEILSL